VWPEDVCSPGTDLDPQVGADFAAHHLPQSGPTFEVRALLRQHPARLDAQALVDSLAVRWHIETFFEYDKDLLGSDHYQLRTAQAILRFWTLTACLMCFLEEQRTISHPRLNTCGDARRKIQDEHRRNLLRWLKEQFQAGCTIEQISAQLAL